MLVYLLPVSDSSWCATNPVTCTVIVVLVVLLVVAGVIAAGLVAYFKKQKKLCFKEKTPLDVVMEEAASLRAGEKA